MNFQMFKLNLEKAKEPENNLPTSVGSLKKQDRFRVMKEFKDSSKSPHILFTQCALMLIS